MSEAWSSREGTARKRERNPKGKGERKTERERNQRKESSKEKAQGKKLEGKSSKEKLMIKYVRFMLDI
ncbi:MULTISPECIES: hypothetical protein [unclassified Paenibacillus]|uniref:hypothetical protein n=1 Tax=unclassified Paenibacillus TaxID=185978 RepID=UPI0011C41337|nr:MULTISPECIES: hypothetical protein [unclassified Paenibacillus]QID16097.1 hypothetical protein CIC07_25575 [Paenibacillus sp. RUD330]